MLELRNEYLSEPLNVARYSEMKTVMI